MGNVYEYGQYAIAAVVIVGVVYYCVWLPVNKYVLVPSYNYYFPQNQQEMI